LDLEVEGVDGPTGAERPREALGFDDEGHLVPSGDAAKCSSNQPSRVIQPYLRFWAATSGGSRSRPRCSSVTRVPASTGTKRTSTSVAGAGGALESRSENTRRSPGSHTSTRPPSTPPPVAGSRTSSRRPPPPAAHPTAT